MNYIYPRTCATSPSNLLTRGSPSMRILGPTARAIVSLQESSWIVIIHLSGELTRWCFLLTTSRFILTRILSFKIVITFAWHHLWCCSTSRAMSALGIFWTSAELVLQLLCWTTSSHPFPAAGQATLHGYSEHKNMILELDMPIGSWIISSHCLLCYYCSSLWYFLSLFSVLSFTPLHSPPW